MDRGGEMSIQISPAKREVLLASLESGMPLSSACKMADISFTTVTKWLQQAELERLKDYEEQDKDYLDFAGRVELAESTLEQSLIKNWITRIKEPGTDWRAVATFLARRFPGNWGEKSTHELTGANGGPIGIAGGNVGLTDEQRAARIAELIALGQASGAGIPAGGEPTGVGEVHVETPVGKTD